MKTYKNLYEPMLEMETIRSNFRSAAKKKTERRDVKEILDNLEAHAEVLHDLLLNEAFLPAYHEPKIIRESGCKKERRIVKPNYKYEQVIHHCVVQQFQPIVLDGFYEHANGSIPGRGCHSGAKTMRRWIRDYNGKKFYVLKMDIRHFFDSIDRDILKGMLRRKIKDKRYVRLLCVIIEYDRIAEAIHILDVHGAEATLEEKKDLATMIAYGMDAEAARFLRRFDLPADAARSAQRVVRERRRGVPLGYYTSQWFGNFYLKELDHFIKQVLKAEHYMRYMDDMVITGRNKKDLHKMRRAISDYLAARLHLELKADWQVFRFEYDTGLVNEKGKPITRGRMLDYMGFQFHHNRKTLRKSALRQTRRKAVRIRRKKEAHRNVSWYEASQMISHMGSITHSDTYGYYTRHIKPGVSVRQLKRIVSHHARKELKNRAREKDRLEASARLAG